MTRNQDDHEPATLLAAALYLMTRHAKNPRPEVCAMVVMQLVRLAEHPDGGLPEHLKRLCGKLAGEWRDLEAESRAASSTAAPPLAQAPSRVCSAATIHDNAKGPDTSALMASLTHLMTAYGETGCPHRGHLVVRMLQSLEADPRTALVLRQTCHRLVVRWQEMTYRAQKAARVWPTGTTVH